MCVEVLATRQRVHRTPARGLVGDLAARCPGADDQHGAFGHGGGADVEQSFFFRDPEGDAAFLSFVVLGSNADHLNMRSVNIDIPVDQQIKGGVVTKTWRCGSSGYFVRLRAYITDAAGNVSRPHDYTINC